MLAALLISQILSWLVIAALVAVVLALARQIGVLHARVAPAGALLGGGTVTPGTIAPPVAAASLAGHMVTVGGPAAIGRRLILFASPACPLCKTLLPVAQGFAADERLALIVAGDDDPRALARMAESRGVPLDAVVNSAELGRAWQVDRLPHAVLLDGDGRIVARGLVNSREQLESLVIAQELGVASIQDFIAARAA